jgi:sterol desaturase/sphingolipid hydroxylase (fatty acid hydroxylase superfamily)
MISKKSFLNFLFQNVFFYSYGFFDYFLYNFFILQQNILAQLFFSFLLSSFRNFFLYFLLFHNIQKYKDIHIHLEYPKIHDYIPSIFQISFLDTWSICVMYYLTPFLTSGFSYFDLLLFIPKSFLFEIIFDFFHYWFHRLEHQIPFLYKNLHKIHHQHHQPTLLSTFNHHYFDLILSNVFPLFISMFICSRIFTISTYMFHMIFITKIYIELCGHSGKDIKTGSFVQCIWLPKLLKITLQTIDHDNHHQLNNCNYGKRFSLWDKVFGTFYKNKPSKKKWYE